jgi:hypothetical protein
VACGSWFCFRRVVSDVRVLSRSLVCSGLHSVVLWDVWPVLLGICAWCLSGSLPGVSHHCLSILQIARCFSPWASPRPDAPPRRQLLKWPCGLPVSCPDVHAWLVEDCLCMTLSCKDFLLQKKNNTKKKREKNCAGILGQLCHDLNELRQMALPKQLRRTLSPGRPSLKVRV